MNVDDAHAWNGPLSAAGAIRAPEYIRITDTDTYLRMDQLTRNKWASSLNYQIGIRQHTTRYERRMSRCSGGGSMPEIRLS